MGQQSNKVQKRIRLKERNKRRKEADKAAKGGDKAAKKKVAAKK